MNVAIKQGLVQLIYATFLHNSEVIALFLGILISLFLLIRRPKRTYTFFLIGFSLLLIRLEYLKHIADPLQKQTVGVVVTEEGYRRTRRFIDLFINDFIPLAMYFTGWGSTFLGIISAGRRKKK
jgi:Na+/phosphate symporter